MGGKWCLEKMCGMRAVLVDRVRSPGSVQEL